MTGKIFQATSHGNPIVLRMVSIIRNESRLAYGENEAGFRLLSLTGMRGWGQPLLPGRSKSIAVPAAAGWMTEITAVPLKCHLPVSAKTATTLYSPCLLVGLLLSWSDRCTVSVYE